MNTIITNEVSLQYTIKHNQVVLSTLQLKDNWMSVAGTFEALSSANILGC